MFRHCNPSDLLSQQPNWQLKWGHFSQKRKFCALLAISNHRTRTRTNTNPNDTEADAAGRSVRDLIIIQCIDKPYLVYQVGPRRKITENVSFGYRHFFLGAHLARPVQLGCTTDFERFWPILGPKFNRISCFLVSGFPHSILSKYRATVVRPYELG